VTWRAARARGDRTIAAGEERGATRAWFSARSTHPHPRTAAPVGCGRVA